MTPTRPLARHALALAACIALTLPSAFAQAPAAAVVATDDDRSCPQLVIEGVRPGSGRLLIAVFDSADAFRKSPALSVSARAGAARQRLSLCGLSGAVAVTVIQDLNGNGALDTNPFGMPTEPWGASGRATMGAPSWDSAQVSLAGGAVTVTLR